MVKRTCEVVSCLHEVSSTVSLHQVPRNETGWEPMWFSFLQLANSEFTAWKPKKKSIFVCSRHFKTNHFRVSTTGKHFILDGCHPCIDKGVDISHKMCENLSEELTRAQRGKATQSDLDNEQGLEIEINQASQVKISKPDEHEACNQVIGAQVKFIGVLKNQLSLLTEEIAILKIENEKLKRNTISALQKKINRRDEQLKRKSSDVDDLKEENKKMKLNLQLPEPSTQADPLLIELVHRRNVPHSRPYSTPLKSFAFNCHYISPKGYSYVRQILPTILPDPTNCQKWTKEVSVKPGLLPQSILEISTTCSCKKMYYSLSFDELAIRQQIVFDGNRMLGAIDFGGLIPEGAPALAKSALLCLVTEINGNKSFPLAYLLTNGLKSNVMAQVVEKCINAVESANGNVLSISFDGLRANFAAIEQLGACLTINSADFKPFIQNEDSSKTRYLIPDGAHMLKLVRNTLEKHEVLYNSDMKEREQLRAANKLTSRHVNFHQKKMNVKLCMQVLSNRTATAIDFCRNIGIDGFEGSEATTEFLRINNFTFDLLNTRPFGQDCKEPLSANNEMTWSTLINPNATQLANTVKAMLCFKLAICKNGNCDPQEDLLDKLSPIALSATFAESLDDEEESFNDDQYDTTTQLSLFVENIVVYIAGFVGKKMNESLRCCDCLSSLNSSGDFDMNMREDFTLLLQRDNGGLFKLSEDLVHVCKISEKIIRIEQSGGIFRLDIKRVALLVKKECIGKNIFSNLHREYSCSVFRQASFDLHSSHKFTLISEICRVYSKVRLHYIAKRASLLAKPVTNRNTLNNLVQFKGF